MDDNYVPAQAINNYVWKLLQDKLGWDGANYGDLMPIIPASREPEFSNYDQPYIVYGYSTETDSDDWFLPTEVLAYSVFGATPSSVNAPVKLISNALRRKDESAHDVNAWIHSSTNPASAEFEGLTFGFISLAHSEGSGAEQSEGGAVDGLVVVRYAYAIGFDKDEFSVV